MPPSSLQPQVSPPNLISQASRALHVDKGTPGAQPYRHLMLQCGADDGDLVHHVPELIRAPTREAATATTGHLSTQQPRAGLGAGLSVSYPPKAQPKASGATCSHGPVVPREPVVWHSSTKTRASY